MESKSSNYGSNNCFNILRVIYLIHTKTIKILSVNVIFCKLLLLCSLISSTNSHPTGTSAITNNDKIHLLMSLKIIFSVMYAVSELILNIFVWSEL